MNLKGLLVGVAIFSAGCVPAAKNLTKDNFESVLKSADKPVVVDFYADWCGPCNKMEGPYNKIAHELKGKAYFYKFDMESDADIPEMYHVRRIPTTIIFDHEHIWCKWVGFGDKETLRGKIEDCLEKIH